MSSSISAQNKAFKPVQNRDIAPRARRARVLPTTQGSIDCLRLNRLARMAGAPVDKGAGITVFKKIGDRVEAGDAGPGGGEGPHRAASERRPRPPR